MAHGREAPGINDPDDVALQIVGYFLFSGELIQQIGNMNRPILSNLGKCSLIGLLRTLLKNSTILYQEAVTAVVDSRHDKAVTGQLLRVDCVFVARHPRSRRDNDQRKLVIPSNWR